MRELFKMFLNLDVFGKCSSVSRIPRIPALGSSGPLMLIGEERPHQAGADREGGGYFKDLCHYPRL